MKTIQSDQLEVAQDEPAFILLGSSKYGQIGLAAVAAAMAKDGVDREIVSAVREHALEMSSWPNSDELYIETPKAPERVAEAETGGDQTETGDQAETQPGPAGEPAPDAPKPAAKAAAPKAKTPAAKAK